MAAAGCAKKMRSKSESSRFVLSGNCVPAMVAQMHEIENEKIKYVFDIGCQTVSSNIKHGKVTVNTIY